MPGNATTSGQADANALLLDHLGIERAVVIRFSAGSGSVCEFARRHPERVIGQIHAAGLLADDGTAEAMSGLRAGLARDRFDERASSSRSYRSGKVAEAPALPASASGEGISAAPPPSLNSERIVALNARRGGGVVDRRWALARNRRVGPTSRSKESSTVMAMPTVRSPAESAPPPRLMQRQDLWHTTVSLRSLARMHRG
jgi:pimeloyl-ACP methyl ester carboxylesterase